MRKLILFFFLLTNNYSFSQSSGYIYGGGNICDNNGSIDVEISLTGTPPWNIIYSIDGINQPIFVTSDNPHIIKTRKLLPTISKNKYNLNKTYNFIKTLSFTTKLKTLKG